MLGDYPLSHFSEGGTGIDGEVCVGENSGGLEGYLCEVDAEIAESTGFFAFEDSDGFFDFESVACGSSEGLIHIADDSFDFEARGGADLFKGGGETACFGGGFHESAGTGFDIESDDFGSAGDLFAEDATDDQREAGDGSGDITQGVKRFIGGGETGGLTSEGDADIFGLSFHLVGREIGVKAGDRSELIDCAASFSEAGAGHFDDG